MGEGYGDLFGMEVLNEFGYVPVTDENPYAIGAYVSGNKVRSIRNYPMNASPLNYADMGYDPGAGDEVHSDGEIWMATNFELRQALANKYNGRYPGQGQGRAARVRERHPSCQPLPGQPSLDPARLRRHAPHARRPDDARRSRRHPRGRHAAVRRREPERALACVRASRHGPQRVQHAGRQRHRPAAGLLVAAAHERRCDVPGSRCPDGRRDPGDDLRRRSRGARLARRRHGRRRRTRRRRRTTSTRPPSSRRGRTASSPARRGTATCGSHGRSPA